MARLPIVSLVLTIALLSTIQVTRGQFSNTTPYLQVTLDKAYYYPGDSGAVSVDIKDTLSMNILVYNLTITFPWRAYINGHWDGNQTISLNGATGQAVASGAWLPTVKISFTMPSDSRYFFTPYYFGGSQGQLVVWSTGVGPSGGPGSFSTPFIVGNAYYATGFEWHTITYILVVMTILVGIMTVSVIYYVRSSLKQRRTTFTAPPSSTSSGLHLENSS